MKSTLLKSLEIDNVPVEIRLSEEKEESKEVVTKFIYELLSDL